MKTLSVFVLVVSMLVVAPTLRADSVLRGTMDLTFHPENLPDGPIWIGTISGDINGDMSFINTGGAYRGSSEHFWEKWLITGTGGNMLAGTDKGVVVYANLTYRMNGEVTEATGDWAYLLGRPIHASGVLEFDAEGNLVAAPGTFQIE